MSVASLSTATSDSDGDLDVIPDIGFTNEDISVQGKRFIQRLLLKVIKNTFDS